VAYISLYGAWPDYGDLWGTDDLAFFSRYDGLVYFRINPLGAYCLGMATDYQPSIPETQAVLRVLPNLEIATVGEPLEPADEMFLNCYAQQISDVIWKLDQARLLEAVEAGHSVSALQELLQARSDQPLPETGDPVSERYGQPRHPVAGQGRGPADRMRRCRPGHLDRQRQPYQALLPAGR